ncbi:MAG: DUF192 domain-containing protein [Candidatus Hydrogenedentota bacterium]|nr:MAG: DUF192 domain-containing protein [Candidatus Hydrogenedentota bacterium]
MGMRIKFIKLLSFVISITLVFIVHPKEAEPLPTIPATLVNLKKQRVKITLEVAYTRSQKARGLMFRKSLPKNHGMLFVYKSPQILSFWMKNTSLPLSIAFLNAKKQILEIYPMNPFSERIIRSDSKVQYAIEMKRGWFRKNLVYPGTKVNFTLPSYVKEEAED